MALSDPSDTDARLSPPHIPAAHSFRLMGAVDHVSHRVMRGWAWSPDIPHRRLQLDVFYLDIFLGRVSTGHFRLDLLRAGYGDGHAGFVFGIPADVPDDADAARFSVVTAGPHRHALPSAPHEVVARPDSALPTSYREMLGAYLISLRDALVDAADGKPGRRSRIDTLCAPAERGMSAFVEHIARKYGREELRQGNEGAFWRWYLGTYAMERGERLAPLSRGDIDRLTRSRGLMGALAVLLFAEEIVGGAFDDISYRWAIETSRRLWVEDCLVGSGEAATLRAVRKDEASSYPLSAFMHVARREIAILGSMPTATEAERRALYGLLLILGLRDPHLLIYMPKRWLRRLLRDRRLFETTQVELFGADLALPHARYAALLAATGFDPSTQTFKGHRYNGHRVRHGPMIFSSSDTVDVQIFGPFSRRMGLGESARRVVGALEAAPFSLNVVDYDIGNTSRADDVGSSRFGRPRTARLNILHLNAEEIPEALANLPDVFSPAPLVAIPYWELSRMAGVHRLGLQAVDEVWVASQFLAGVFADAGKPVHCTGMCCNEDVAPSEADRRSCRARYGHGEETFVFLTTSDALSWEQRKNPHGAVEAFAAAFTEQEDVALVVKTQNLDGPLTVRQKERWERIRMLCDADPRITLINESFDAAAQRTLLAACDGLVSLHRAEGLGLDTIDALHLGRAVVATAYSGTTDHCTPQTSWPVDADLVPVAPDDYCFVERGHVWADPRTDSARDTLRAVVFDHAERRRRIAAGRALVQEHASRDVYGRRLAARVRHVLEQ